MSSCRLALERSLFSTAIRVPTFSFLNSKLVAKNSRHISRVERNILNTNLAVHGTCHSPPSNLRPSMGLHIQLSVIFPSNLKCYSAITPKKNTNESLTASQKGRRPPGSGQSEFVVARFNSQVWRLKGKISATVLGTYSNCEERCVEVAYCGAGSQGFRQVLLVGDVVTMSISRAYLVI